MTIQGFREAYRWLSNFWPVDIEYEGRIWASTEHAYQAAKTLLRTEKNVIHEASSPGQAKRLGRKLTVRSDWSEVKASIMLELQRLKYQDPELSQKLLLTGTCYIEETNTWGDTYWGVCDGVGQNTLGHILMQVRDELRLMTRPSLV